MKSWISILTILYGVIPLAIQFSALDYYSVKYSAYGINYDQDDSNHGMWNSDYGYALSGYDSEQCGGCNCNDDDGLLMSCTGPTVTLVAKTFPNITKGMLDTGITSITIINCPSLTVITDDAVVNLTSLETLIVQGTGLTTVPDISTTAMIIMNLNSNSITITTNNYKGWKLPSTLTHLSLAQNQIYWIPSEWLSGASLRVVSFSSNQLTQLQNNIFDVSNLGSLVYLGFDGNQLTRLSKTNMKPLVSAPNCVHLNLSNNQINSIASDTFNQLSTLKILELHGNALSTIQARVFTDMPDLLHLDLHGNAFAEITSNSFLNLPSLIEFRLHSQTDPLTSIAYDAWYGIGASLVLLYVSSNNLSTFPHQVLSEDSYPFLEIIHADNNEISDVNEYGTEAFTIRNKQLYASKAAAFTPFSTYPELRKLYLNNNLITTITSTDYCELQKLQYLILADNQITEDNINSDAFACLPVLYDLDLDKNQIQYVPEALTKATNLPSLKYLRLEENDITFIETGTFTSLPALTHLYFYLNKIVVIEDDSFPPALHFFDLRWNDFHFVHSHPFSNLINLDQLRLNGNEIDYIPDDAFINCTSLRDLWLNYNNFPQLKKVHLQSCPLDRILLSGSNIGWIEDGTFDHITNARRIDADTNKLTYLPNGGDYNDLKLTANHLDFSGNRLASIQSGVFRNFQILHDIKLANNMIASIKTEAFHTVDAKDLYLTGNVLRELNQGSFNSCKFDEIFMNGLYFSEIPTQTFFGVSANHIYLQNGQLSKINNQAFHDVTVTGNLDLSRNQLTVIDEPMFGGSSSVTGILYLNNNGMTGLIENAFDNVAVGTVNLQDNQFEQVPSALTTLNPTYIYLERNLISYVLAGTFTGMTGVQEMYLGENLLTSIETGIWDDLTSLQILSLNDNSIEEIQSGALDGLSSLRVLNLQGNRLSHLPGLGSMPLQEIYLADNNIETIEAGAFSGQVATLSVLDISNNPLGCQCEVVLALHDVKDAITGGECMFPTATLNITFASSSSDQPNYYLNSDLTLFQCAAKNVDITGVSGTELTISFDQPDMLYAQTNATDNGTFVGPWVYEITCVSTTAATVTKTVTDANADTLQFSSTVLNSLDGIISGADYECSIKLTVGNYTSAKSSPAFTAASSSTSITSNTTVDASDIVLNITYYDFSVADPDFDHLGYFDIATPSYIASPYGAWPAISSTPITDTFSNWFRSVSGTNQVFETTLVLDSQSDGTNKYYSNAYFPLDNQGYGAEGQFDCSDNSHNFGFTGAIRSGLKFSGTEKVTVGAEEAFWLFINKVLVMEYVATADPASVTCIQVDLSPAANSGGGTVIPQAGTISGGGACTGLSPLTTLNSDLALEVGVTYHFDLFHAEYMGCSSNFFMEVENVAFYDAVTSGGAADSGTTGADTGNATAGNTTDTGNTTAGNTTDTGNTTSSGNTTSTTNTTTAPEEPLDYSVTLAEDFHVNGIVETIFLTDVFSTGPFQVVILSGNEGRHFTIKDDTAANQAAGVAPAAVPPTYTAISGTDVLYVACSGSSSNTEPNVAGTESFSMSTTTALLTLATSLDYELVTSYYVTLEVVDSGAALTGTVAVRIFVTDVNDNCPELTETTFTSAPIPVLTASPLFTLTATDKDTGINAEIFYVVSSFTADPPVDYNSSLSLWDQVYPNQTTLTFEVVVMDKGDPALGTPATASVTISNTCIVDVLFEPIDVQFIADNSTGDVYLRIPKYWVVDFACTDNVGISSGYVLDNRLSASSSFSASTTSARGRLNITENVYSGLSGGWVAGTVDQNQHIEVDLEVPYKITKVYLQGRQEEPHWVTSFRIYYTTDTAGNWTLYTNSTGDSVFEGNTDQDTIVTTDLDPAIEGQYVRINPYTWSGTIALRFELGGCQQAEQLYYDTSCEPCYATYYCEGDGLARTCGRCDPPQDNSTCGRSRTEHSFGKASECSPCPSGWHCSDGRASICEEYYYISCTDDSCPNSCSPCEPGNACLDGIKTECGPGTYSDGQEYFCQACAPGYYQDLSGQSICKPCDAGYFSTSRMDRCGRCEADEFAVADGSGCQACTSLAECPCLTGDKCFNGTGCNNLDSGNYDCDPCADGYTGDGTDCVDIDECFVYDPCFQSRCVNTEPGYQCLACPLGYIGTYEDAYAWNVHRRVFELNNTVLAALQEQTCLDIDECLTDNGGCDPNMACVNTAGSYECTFCNTGYIGSPIVGCSLADFCASGAHDCGSGADCIYIGPAQYRCQCAVGYAGNGELCGLDSDNDGHPDSGLPCADWGCKRDNCQTVPNSVQEDIDNDQVGDNCDPDTDGDGIKDIYDNCIYNQDYSQTDGDGDGIGDVCEPSVIDSDGDGTVDSSDNCPVVPNSSQQDLDGDGVGDACDNCVSTSNANQADSNGNGIGDSCDTTATTDIDADGDGVLDTADNCPDVANGDQADNDDDGTGNICDTDIDGDGVLNAADNCPYRSNAAQTDSDGNGVGDDCASDSDADGVDDKNDTCPYNSALHTTSFRSYFTVDLYPGLSTTTPEWIVKGNGAEVIQTANTGKPAMLIGLQNYGEIEYSGTMYVDSSTAEDYIGFVFGYVHDAKFYLVMWKRTNYNYGTNTYKAGTKGIQLKLVDSTLGPGQTLGYAVWHSQDTANHVTLLWQDPDLQGWEAETAYHWVLTFKPSIAYISFKIYTGETAIIDSGAIYSNVITGGKVGVFQFGEFPAVWSNLKVTCLEHENSALYLDGIDDSAELGDILTLQLNDSFTFEVWVKMDSGTTGPQPILCTLSQSACLYVESGFVVVRYGFYALVSNTVLNDEQWYNVIVIFQLGEQSLTIYIDGAEDATAFTPGDIDWDSITSSNDTVLYLGRDANNFFKGTLDEVRIYDISLLSTELLTHIESPNLDRPKYENYVNVHLRMEDPAGATTLTNSGVVSVSPTLSGNPSFVQSLQDSSQFALAYPNN